MNQKKRNKAKAEIVTENHKQKQKQKRKGKEKECRQNLFFSEPAHQMRVRMPTDASSAVVVGDRAYLVDFGPGVVRQASAAYFNGVDALRPDLLTVALLYARFTQTIPQDTRI